MSPKSYVIHDVYGFFKSWLKVLKGSYDEALLELFLNSLGVPSHPQIEDYRSLWRDKTRNNNHGKLNLNVVWFGSILYKTGRFPPLL